MLKLKKLPNDTEDARFIMIDLLQVWDHNHYIMICSPNKIYEDFNLDNFNDWSNTLPVTLSKKDDVYRSSTPEVSGAIRYLKNNLDDDIFAVVELDPRLFPLVRGIIKKDEDSFKIAVNPVYEEYRPKTIIDKYNRVLTDYTLYFSDYFKEKNNKQLIKK